MKKKYIVILIAVVFIIGGIGGGIYMDKKKEKISIEQQQNVASWIVRSYSVSEITFLKITKDNNTGSITLYFKLNDQDKFETGITASDTKEFDNSVGLVGLNPISNFEELKKEDSNPNAPVNLKKIKIEYIGE
jgi:hypothetical protein